MSGKDKIILELTEKFKVSEKERKNAFFVIVDREAEIEQLKQSNIEYLALFKNKEKILNKRESEWNSQKLDIEDEVNRLSAERGKQEEKISQLVSLVNNQAAEIEVDS